MSLKLFPGFNAMAPAASGRLPAVLIYSPAELPDVAKRRDNALRPATLAVPCPESQIPYVQQLQRSAAVKLAKPLGSDVFSVRAGAFEPWLTGAALLAAVRDEAKKGFSSQSYEDTKWAMYATIDSVIVEGVRGVYCSYSGLFIPGDSGNGAHYKEDGDQNGDGFIDRDGMNVEHLWPQSLFDQRLPMRSDLHHLLPTFMHPNGMRSNFPFGEIAESDVIYHTSAGAKLSHKQIFEPPDAVKGQIARGLFYFLAQYYGTEDIFEANAAESFWNRSLATLMSWNEKFPPDAWERERNERIQAFQGNRNPFVDDPSLVGRIGRDAFHVASVKPRDRRRVIVSHPPRSLRVESKGA